MWRHVHTMWTFTYTEQVYTLMENVFLNPGRLVYLFSRGETQFMIFTWKDRTWVENFISLKYDVDRTILEVQEEKLEGTCTYWSKITEQIFTWWQCEPWNSAIKNYETVQRRNWNVCMAEYTRSVLETSRK